MTTLTFASPPQHKILPLQAQKIRSSRQAQWALQASEHSTTPIPPTLPFPPQLPSPISIPRLNLLYRTAHLLCLIAEYTLLLLQRYSFPILLLLQFYSNTWTWERILVVLGCSGYFAWQVLGVGLYVCSTPLVDLLPGWLYLLFYRGHGQFMDVYFAGGVRWLLDGDDK